MDSQHALNAKTGKWGDASPVKEIIAQISGLVKTLDYSSLTREVADAVVKGIMKSFFDPGITTWLRYGGDDCISLAGHFSRTIGYGFRKGEERLEENLRKARLVLVKDADADWGFRILTSYPMFGRREKFCG